MDDVTRPEVRHSTCFQYVFCAIPSVAAPPNYADAAYIDLIILSEAGLNNIDRTVRCQARLAKKFMLLLCQRHVLSVDLDWRRCIRRGRVSHCVKPAVHLSHGRGNPGRGYP